MKPVDLLFYTIVLSFVVLNLYAVHAFDDVQSLKFQLFTSTGIISMLTYFLMRVKAPKKPEKFKLLRKA
jgi:hypothetical protein